jgi:hypothetical protein
MYRNENILLIGIQTTTYYYLLIIAQYHIISGNFTQLVLYESLELKFYYININKLNKRRFRIYEII